MAVRLALLVGLVLLLGLGARDVTLVAGDVEVAGSDVGLRLRHCGWGCVGRGEVVDEEGENVGCRVVVFRLRWIGYRCRRRRLSLCWFTCP